MEILYLSKQTEICWLFNCAMLKHCTFQHLFSSCYTIWNSCWGKLLGNIWSIVARKLLKYYFNNIWLPELYNVVYAQEYFGYFGGLLGIMPVIEHLPVLPMRSQWCWWHWGNHRMGKGERIDRGDKKDNILWDLFVEGWSTSVRRNNFRETKVDPRIPPSVMQSCLACVC